MNIQVQGTAGDGVPDLVFNNYGTITFFHQDVLTSAGGGPVPTISHIDLTTVTTARAALDGRGTLLESLGSVRGTIGAYQSRLQSVVRRLQGTSLEYDAARLHIVDADIAEESSKLIALTIRQQVGTSLLAQANQIPALALTLLKR